MAGAVVILWWELGTEGNSSRTEGQLINRHRRQRDLGKHEEGMGPRFEEVPPSDRECKAVGCRHRQDRAIAEGHEHTAEESGR